MLGGLEQKIMEILWGSSEPLKPSAVLAQMKGKYAYTTIMTVLKRMADKKLVKRQLKGNVYLYQAATNKAVFASECLDDLFARVLDSYGDLAVSSFQKVVKKATA
jgi:predicted transcriptional regulator